MPRPASAPTTTHETANATVNAVERGSVKIEAKIGNIDPIATPTPSIAHSIRLLVWPLHHAGIALATSLSAVLNASLLFYFLRKRGFYVPCEGWGYFGLRLVVANLALGVWLWLGRGELQDWLAGSSLWRIEHLALLLGGAGVIYGASLWLTGLRPAHLLMEQTSSA